MYILHKDHLHCQSYDKRKQADFQGGEFHDFDCSDNNGYTEDIINDPIFVREVVTNSYSYSYK